MTTDVLAQMPVTQLKGVGPKSAERLARLGIHTVLDILFHLPLRYQDRTRVAPIASLRPGDEVVIEGHIEAVELRFGRRRSMLVWISDDTGRLALRFFHFSAAQKNAMQQQAKLRCFGEVRNGPASYELVHPEYHFAGASETEAVEANLTPVYPTTEGMHQLSWRDLTAKALELLQQHPDDLPDCLPPEWLGGVAGMSLAEALCYLHRPPVEASTAQLQQGRHPAQQRLALEELVAHQLSLRELRHKQQQSQAPALRNSGRLRKQLLAKLPFALTGAQQRVGEEIAADLAREQPMLRLVQGDVGSGKTVVAAMAALQAIESGCQVALMAPTELLAEQHFKVLQQWLEPELTQVGLLTGRIKGRSRAAVLQALSSQELPLLVGTQALFQDDVIYPHLGLVIVDEQHRFGVHQRLALQQKGRHAQRLPHQLIMTATPIPRSLAMTAYADLDLSVIDELPPGRTPVQTAVVSDARREQIIARVRKACQGGRQAYWVCTLIEESEVLQCQAAEDTAAELAKALPELGVGLVHGRMKATEKEAIMVRFKQGELHLLVATTVIEVGVDVPRASLMIIENPERLGLSQLHQLRGRVGRGTTDSHCVLMYHPPLGQQARQRLAILRETTDGFVIAQKDLELRGPGEVLGVRQTGEIQFRIADIMRDQHLLELARTLADRLLQQRPQAVSPLIQRWLGDKGHYARV